MAFTTTERVQIRRYMGASALYQNLDTRLESAIDAIEADATQETEVRGTLLAELILIDAAIKKARSAAIASAADGVSVDAYRGVIMLCREGRMYAQRLARILGFDEPRGDAFGTTGGGAFQRMGLR